MKVFETVADLALANLQINQVVRTKGAAAFNDGLGGLFLIESVGSGVTIANGNIAVPQATDGSMSPMSFGAVGDGTTDDTAAVQACLNIAQKTIIDRVFAVTNLGTSNYFECINGGEFKYIGAANLRLMEFTGTECGVFRGDANNLDVNLFYIPDSVTEEVHVSGIYGKNVTSGAGSNNTQTVATLFGAKQNVGFIHAKDCSNTGNPNGSFPQTVATGLGETVIGVCKFENCVSGLVPVGFGSPGAETFVQSLYAEGLSDNGIYAFNNHYVNVGEVVYEGDEEPVVNDRAFMEIDKITAIGRCFSVLRCQSAAFMHVGTIVGRAPAGITTDIDKLSNLPRGVYEHRSGNATTGEIYIDNVVGEFTESLVKTGFGSGTTDLLSIKNIDVKVYWENQVRNPNWNVQNWLNYGGVLQMFIGDANIQIFDVYNELTGSTFFIGQWGSSAGRPISIINNLNVSLTDNLGIPSLLGAAFRGNPQQENLIIHNGRWQTNVGPYLRDVEYGSPNTFGNSTLPTTTSWWHQGQSFLNSQWNGVGGGVVTKEIFVNTEGDAAGGVVFVTFNP